MVQSLVSGFKRDISAYTSRKWSLKEWTKSVYLTLRATGQERDYRVYCSDRTPELGGYLFDVVWFNASTFRPDLIAECEWQDIAHIVYDFEKLLWVKAPLKLLICGPETKRDQLLPAILQKIRQYPDHSPGERYLVVDVNGNARGGNAYAYSWQSPENGANSLAEFEPLPESPFPYSFEQTAEQDRP